MVNLKKEENKRKPISLIKPQTNNKKNDSTSNILCEPLLSEFEPRTKHPVYTRSQYENLNQHRTKYKDPEKFDVLPQSLPQGLNCPAVPPFKQPEQQNQHTANKLYADTNDLLLLARIHNNQVQNNQVQKRSKFRLLKRKLSIYEIIVLILLAILLIIILVSMIKSGLTILLIYLVVSVISLFFDNNTKNK